MGGIVFFAGMSLLAMVTVIVQKTIVELRSTRFERLKESYRVQITELLFEPDTVVLSPVRSRLEFEAASDVVIELMEMVKEVSYERLLHRYLHDQGIIDHYIRIASGTSLKRVDALERLAMFRDDRSRIFFTELLKDSKSNEEIVVGGLVGLSYILHAEDVDLFLTTLERIDTSGKFSEFLFYNAIERLLALHLETSVEAMFDRLQERDKILSLKAFIEAVSATHYAPISERLEALYDKTERADLKISVIRALGNLSESKEGCRLIADALQSDNATLRIVASKSIGNCRAGDAALVAARALFDPSYRVRYNIARSLLRLPEGIEHLRRIAESSSDRYARQSAAYALRLLETSHA